MIDPIPRVRFPIQCCILNVDVLISSIEVDVFDRCGFARLPALDVDAFEVGGNDEVDVLAGVGEEAEHGEGDEGAHGA